MRTLTFAWLLYLDSLHFDPQVYDKVVENPYEDTGEDDVTALTGVVNVHFPDMRTWIKDHLTMVAQQVSWWPPLPPLPLHHFLLLILPPPSCLLSSLPPPPPSGSCG